MSFYTNPKDIASHAHAKNIIDDYLNQLYSLMLKHGLNNCLVAQTNGSYRIQQQAKDIEYVKATYGSSRVDTLILFDADFRPGLSKLQRDMLRIYNAMWILKSTLDIPIIPSWKNLNSTLAFWKSLRDAGHHDFDSIYPEEKLDAAGKIKVRGVPDITAENIALFTLYHDFIVTLLATRNAEVSEGAYLGALAYRVNEAPVTISFLGFKIPPPRATYINENTGSFVNRLYHLHQKILGSLAQFYKVTIPEDLQLLLGEQRQISAYPNLQEAAGVIKTDYTETHLHLTRLQQETAIVDSSNLASQLAALATFQSPQQSAAIEQTVAKLERDYARVRLLALDPTGSELKELQTAINAQELQKDILQTAIRPIMAQVPNARPALLPTLVETKESEASDKMQIAIMDKLRKFNSAYTEIHALIPMLRARHGYLSDLTYQVPEECSMDPELVAAYEEIVIRSQKLLDFYISGVWEATVPLPPALVQGESQELLLQNLRHTVTILTQRIEAFYHPKVQPAETAVDASRQTANPTLAVEEAVQPIASKVDVVVTEIPAALEEIAGILEPEKAAATELPYPFEEIIEHADNVVVTEPLAVFVPNEDPLLLQAPKTALPDVDQVMLQAQPACEAETHFITEKIQSLIHTIDSDLKYASTVVKVESAEQLQDAANLFERQLKNYSIQLATIRGLPEMHRVTAVLPIIAALDHAQELIELYEEKATISLEKSLNGLVFNAFNALQKSIKTLPFLQTLGFVEPNPISLIKVADFKSAVGSCQRAISEIQKRHQLLQLALKLPQQFRKKLSWLEYLWAAIVPKSWILGKTQFLRNMWLDVVSTKLREHALYLTEFNLTQIKKLASPGVINAEVNKAFENMPQISITKAAFNPSLHIIIDKSSHETQTNQSIGVTPSTNSTPSPLSSPLSASRCRLLPSPRSDNGKRVAEKQRDREIELVAISSARFN